MNKEYQIRIYQYPNGDTFDWVAEYPDLTGCLGAGDTIEEALAEAQINKQLWLEEAVKIGKEIPVPSTSFSDSYSGKFNLRLPTSLHRDLALQAESEGVSLNAICSSLLAKGLYSNNSNNQNNSTDCVRVILPPVITNTSFEGQEWKNIYKQEACSIKRKVC